jgi:hypothetical protein
MNVYFQILLLTNAVKSTLNAHKMLSVMFGFCLVNCCPQLDMIFSPQSPKFSLYIATMHIWSAMQHAYVYTVPSESIQTP